MPGLPRRRVAVFIAINEIGDYYLSQIDAQDALTNLAQKCDGQVYRVVDVTVDIPYARKQESASLGSEKLNAVRRIDL